MKSDIYNITDHNGDQRIIKRSYKGVYFIRKPLGENGRMIWDRTTAHELCSLGCYDQMQIEKKGKSLSLKNTVVV